MFGILVTGKFPLEKFPPENSPGSTDMEIVRSAQKRERD